MWTTCFLLSILAVSAQALSVTETHSYSLVTSVQCFTHNSNVSPTTPIPTSTTTEHLLPDISLIIENSTPIVTSTGSAVTATSSVVTAVTVTTTAAATTETFSSTSTVTAVVTTDITSTILSTVTASTTTSTTSTSIVPAPSGFEPSFETAGEMTLEGSSPKHRRNELESVRHGGALITRRSRGSSNLFGNNYPSSVLCIDYIQAHWVEKIVIIAGTTSTSTVPGTVTTTTVTSTQTSTSTEVPDVSTTVTSTTTTTSTQTDTDISSGVTTSTSTLVITSTATSYAACATNNILGPQIANGSYTNEGSLLVSNGAEYSYVFNSDSAYDCCVSCVTDQFGNHCQISVFQPNGANGVCQVIGQDPGQDNSALCNNPGLAVLGVEYTQTPSEFSPIIFSNGPCGVVVSH